MRVDMMAVQYIQPYPRNAKKHPPEQVEKIKQSIQKFGFNQPIVIDMNNVIIVGHGRFQAAKEMELEKVPVYQVNLTEDQAKAYRLMDNRTNESEWDMDFVFEEIKELDLAGFNLELTGFDGIDMPDDADYSLLEGQDLGEELTGKTQGVRKAIQIDFDHDDFEKAKLVTVFLRNKGVYLGGEVLSHLYELAKRYEGFDA